MNGPSGDFRYNNLLPEHICHLINHSLWKVVTPSILVLASIALEEGFEVELADEAFREVDLEKHYDIISFYVITPNAKRSYYLAKKLKEKGCHIVMGGVHPLFMTEEVKQHCDTVMLGEGEVIFRKYLRDVKLNCVKAMYKQEKGKINIKNSPVPAFKILNHEEQKLIPIQTARGCSHACRFCNVRSLYGNNLRTKSFLQINKELAEAEKLQHGNMVYITDDNILSNQKHFKMLISIMKNTRFTWYANTDISFGADEQLIQKAWKSGLRQVLIGLEGVQESTLIGIDKDAFKQNYMTKYKEYIDKIQSHGIGVIGSFIVGNETDTPDTFKKLYEFILESKLYGASITVATPYPGTALYYKLEEEDKILTYNWDYYTIFQPLIKMKYITQSEFNKEYTNLLSALNSSEFKQMKLHYFSNIYKELRK